MRTIEYLLCEKSQRLGKEKWIGINYTISPHCLWAGRTGSGKSVAAKILLARTSILAPPEMQPVEITIIDPKEDIDFDYLEGMPRYYRGERSPQGFNDIYNSYIRRKEKIDKTTNLKVLFVDEFSSLISLISEKKEREEVQRKLGLMLMLSRSRRFSIQMATHQPSAKLFGENSTASREQFGSVCLLGDAGSETQAMLFDSVSREQIKQHGSIGGSSAGWMSLNGDFAVPVRVPHVEDMEKLNAVIRDNLTREKEHREE